MRIEIQVYDDDAVYRLEYPVCTRAHDLWHGTPANADSHWPELGSSDLDLEA